MTGAAVDLTAHLRPGDAVLVGQGPGEPRSLVEAVIAHRHAVAGLSLFVGSSYSGLFVPELVPDLRFRSYGGVGRTSALTRQGVAEVVSAHLGTIPDLITSGRIPVDVVLVQVSEADEHGRHSLGLVADYLQAAMAVARTVLAEVNPRVPFTGGDTLVPGERLALTVRDERPLIEVPPRDPSPEERAIGALVAELVPDGATIQFGVGGTPDAVLQQLGGRRDLGVHSGLLTDAVVDLIEGGTITNARKPIDAGLTVTGSLYGTERLYRWADHNPDLVMRPVSYTHHPGVLARIEDLHAINAAVEVDLTGQVNAEMVGGRYVGALGGQGAFARAGVTAPRGRSIIALPSTAVGGTVSRVVPRLGDGVVTTARSEADLIVTEHGVADLRGVDLDHRPARLIAIAHPDHREALERARREASGR